MTQQISRDDVLHLAQLSAIALADDEINALRDDLASILNYIEQLGELDTTGVEPTYQVTGLENAFRPDEIEHASVDIGGLVSAAAESKDQQFKVPKVL